MQLTSILRFAACIGLWLFITTISNAAPTDNTEKITDLQRDVAVIKDTTILRLEAQKDALQKDLQNLQSKIDQQDKRIGDISAETGRFSIVAGGLSILITLLVAFAGLFSWSNAGRKAKEATHEGIEKYARELTKSTDAAIAEVNEKAKQAIDKIDQHVIAAKTSQLRMDELVNEAEEKLQKQVDAGSKPSLTPEEMKALNAKDERLKEIPENQYTFDDWNSRAFAALASSDLEEAAHFFLQASNTKGASKLQVTNSLLNRGLALVKLKRYEEGIDAYDTALTQIGEPSKLVQQEQFASAMINKGVALSELNQVETAIKVYEQIITRFSNSTELALREMVAFAMVNKGIALRKTNKSEMAISAFDQIITRFGSATEPELRTRVAKAMVGKGIALGELGRSDEEVQTYDQVVERFGISTEAFLCEQVASAWHNKGVRLDQLNRPNEAIETYDSLINRFVNSTEVALRESAAMAMVNKGAALNKLERHVEANEVYNNLIKRFGGSADVELHEQVAKAMFNKGSALGQLGRGDEELQTYDELVQRFGKSTKPELRTLVCNALNNIGFKHLLDAKRLWLQIGTRAALLTKARSKFEAAIERSPTSFHALGNLSYAIFLQEQETEAVDPLRRALGQGGEELFNATIKDTETDTVPSDAAFRTLLDKIWSEVKKAKGKQNPTAPPKV
jgi:tetratricopeptide (TPR) repeat protein